jgi:hypothetical protein
MFNIMGRLLKNIQVFFLWLALFIISAHQLIPHDHHTDDSSISNDLNCPISKQHTKHKPLLPDHCHIFNDFSSETQKLYHYFHENQTNLVALKDFFTEDISFTQVTASNIIASDDFITYHSLVDTSHLRAPPALS